MHAILSVLCIVLLSSLSTQAQHASIDVRTMAGVKGLATDPLHALYVIAPGNRVIKVDTNYRLLHQVQIEHPGDINSIDAGNPKKVLLFFRNSQTIVLLDNTLTEIQRIKLADWNLHDVQSVMLGPNNSIWLYENTQRRLMNVNEAGEVITSSDPFDALPIVCRDVEMLYEAEGEIILRDKHNTLLVFDEGGKYIQKEMPEITGPMTWYGMNSLIHYTGRHLERYNLNKQSHPTRITTFDVNPPVIRHLAYAKGRLFMSTDEGVRDMPW